MSKKDTNQPVDRFQLRGITASVFENKTDNGAVFYKVSIARTYKDGDQFKTTSVFSRDDLPVVEVLAKKSWIAILQRETKNDSE